MNEKFNDKFLHSLKNRPDLAPRKEFKEKLKTKLFEEMPEPKQSRLKVRSLVPNLLVAVLILVGGYLTIELITNGRGEQNVSQEQEPIQPNQSNHGDPTPEKPTEPEGDNEYNFTLTAEENVVYQAFSEDPTEAHLKGLSPISIAKIYVQASLDERYDLVYEMYTDRPEYVRWTKQEDAKIPQSDRGTKDDILSTFNGIEDGEFIQMSDNDGYIKYDNGGEGYMGFQLIKDEDGYWSVGFMPIQ